ncbi:MAG: ABC transporter ATP-binding protein [Candidatus Binatia bacterium]
MAAQSFERRENGRPLIRIRNLQKRYGHRQALAGIDLELGGRQIVGIVGPDGAGKTTLLRALAGLLDVEAVEASVLGHDLTGPVTELKAQIGYVPQVFSLHKDLSVIENLRFTAHLQRLPASEFARRADDLLAHTGLGPFRDRPAGALSGGMQQKLAVANALLPAPPLLLLDEPTAGVDVLARAEIWALLERARRTALVLMSTSYLDEAGACDRLVYLGSGRVVAVGTPAELCDRVPLDLYRAWGDDAGAIARAARQLPYTDEARANGRFARVAVRRGQSPDVARVVHDLGTLPGVRVDFVESAPLDMEAVLLHVARGDTL